MNIKQIIILLFCVSTIYTASCSRETDNISSVTGLLKTYRDVPGVTMQEISDIEALKKERGSFIYAMTLSTEAFLKESGEAAVGGYAALFCEWLTDLFGIRFQPEIYAWSDLIEKLNSGEIDFAGNLTPTEERRKIYYMTDPVAERQYKTIQLTGSTSLDRIALSRPLRYVFIEGAAIADTVASVTDSSTYESIFVNNYEEAYRTLEKGTADAFIGDSAVILSFDEYGDVYADDFLPLIFSPVSMATAKNELAPFISVITKAQRNGAMPHLQNLFNIGYEEYKKYKFVKHLNDEEKKYLQETVSVPLVTQYFNYPLIYYDSYNKKWNGISMDLLHEVEKLSGLTFKVINKENTEMPELIEMLSDGRGHIFTDLVFTKGRETYFLWNKNKIMADQYALLSGIDYPNVNINEIPHKRIALVGNTAHKEMFNIWFPNADNTTDVISIDEGFRMMDRGEVDMVMAGKTKLLYYLNYFESSGYKANFLFNYTYESTFAYNIEQAVLCSIVDKALAVIDTNVIVEQWVTKTYDYRTQLAEARLPWLIGAVVLSSIILALVWVFFIKSRKDGKRLAKLFDEVSEANKVKNISINVMERVLCNIDAMILVTDPETDEILFVNDSMAHKFGIKGNCVGQLCYKVFQKNMNKRCDFCPCNQLDKEPGKAVVWEKHNSFKNQIFHNTDRYIEWPNRKTVHIQYSVDMTELITAKEFAEQTSRYKSNFLATVSHELRTPMNAILGISEIQLQIGALSPDTEEAFKKIYESGDMLLYIINDILDLSKIEAGKLDLNPVKYNLLNMINDTAQLNSIRYEKKQLQFNIHVDDNTPLELFGDELRIKQVLNNILSNAFKYTNKGKIDFSVSSEIKPDDHGENVTLVFCVSDTGQGMTENQVDKLFDEYTRFNIEANRTTVGVGIGMNIVKRLIDMMDGNIVVKSELDKGSVFTVRIPQKLAGSDVCGHKSSERLQDLRIRNKSILNKTQLSHEYMPYGSVLIVDDVESNLYVIKGMLDLYGLKIDTASSGFEAVEKIKSGSVYDIVFMDHMMPKMDGIEAVKIMRDMGYLHSIIALTANALVGREEMFLQNGFNGYIPKPVDTRELNLILNNFILSKKPAEVVEAARKEKIDKSPNNSASGQAMVKRSNVEKYFTADAKNTINILEDLYTKIDVLGEDGIDQFNVTVHGIKSALANIGEKELSVMAHKLEKAGINHDYDKIHAETPVLIDGLKSLIAKLKPVEEDNDFEISGDNLNFLHEKLFEIKTACTAFNTVAVKTVLNDLGQIRLPDNIKTVLDEISLYVLHSDFEKAAETADNILMENNLHKK